MLKKVFINWENVFYKCVNSTFDYLKEFPKDWTGKNSELNKENISMKIEKFLFTDKLYIKPPGTKPDELVADILEQFCNMDPRFRSNQQKAYNQQKQVEQYMGQLLEFYLLKNSFHLGWIQSGDCIRGTDMIKQNADRSWFKLQIKNSNNTTNSSSAGFIKGKAVTWFRRFAQKGTYNWNNFPDEIVRKNLSEDKFKEFLVEHYSNYTIKK